MLSNEFIPVAVINGNLCKVTRFLEFVYGLVLKKNSVSETTFVPYAVTIQHLSRMPLHKDIGSGLCLYKIQKTCNKVAVNVLEIPTQTFN